MNKKKTTKPLYFLLSENEKQQFKQLALDLNTDMTKLLKKWIQEEVEKQKK